MLRHSVARAHRLDAVLCNIVFFAFIFLASLALLGFLITHTHVFYVSYNSRMQRERNTAWLVQQCKSPEFYSNMKHHATLCDDVALEESDPIWLHALRDVFDTISVCGTKSCEQRIVNAIEFMLGRGLFALVTCSISVFILMLVFIPCYRMYTFRMGSMFKHTEFVEDHPHLMNAHWRQGRSHPLYAQLRNHG